MQNNELAERKESGMLRVPEGGLEQLKQIPERLNEIFKSVMQKDTDYGTIPGTPKPSLWKPGSELLANYFGLRADRLCPSWSILFFILNVLCEDS